MTARIAFVLQHRVASMVRILMSVYSVEIRFNFTGFVTGNKGFGVCVFFCFVFFFQILGENREFRRWGWAVDI